MRKTRLLLVLMCSIALLSPLLLRSSSTEDNQQQPRLSVCREQPSVLACNGTTVSSAASVDATLWTAHSVLTSPMQMYHYAIIRSILHHAQPTVFYLHVSNSTELISAEFSRKLNDEYPNIRRVEYTGPVAEKLSFADIQRVVAPFAPAVYVALSVFLQPPMRVLLASQQCGVDRQTLVVLFHSECPYFKSVNPGREHVSDVVSSDPTNATAPAVAVSPTVYGRLMPYTMSSLIGDDKHWNRVLERSLEARPHREPVVPNIVHYVWFTTKSTWTMTFMQLISVLSNLKVNQVETVFIYGNVPPSGPHWDWLRAHYGDRIQRRHYPIVDGVFGKRLRNGELAHTSDVVRLQLLKRFGGMYFDWDAIALKSHQQFRHYDAVMGSDAPFTDGLASQHVLFRSDSEFLRRYLDNYKQYDARSWGKNAIDAPKDIFLQYPYLLLMPDNFILSPRSDLVTKIYDEPDLFSMDEYFAFHYVSPEPEYYFKFDLTFDSVKRLKGTFGTLLRHVINHPELADASTIDEASRSFKLN